MTEPRNIHDHDQLLAAIRELAAVVAAYYRALIDEGMDPEDALILTVARQRDICCAEEEE